MSAREASSSASYIRELRGAFERRGATIERQRDEIEKLAYLLCTVAEDPFVRHLNCGDEVMAWWEMVSRG